jgi:hypothetical protein
MRRGLWRLEEDYEAYCGILVPSGTESDGASVPALFRWFVYPEGELFYPAFVHDHVLDMGYGWRDAARMLDEEMVARGVKPFKRAVVHAAIRIWGVLR